MNIIAIFSLEKEIVKTKPLYVCFKFSSYFSGFVDIRAESWELDGLLSLSQGQGMNYHVYIEDVSALIAENDRLQKIAKSSSDRSMDWKSYHTFDEVRQALSYENVEFSTKLAFSFKSVNKSS